VSETRFYAALPARGVIEITGEDRVEFLQGLVSNDVTKVAADRAIYAALLTAQGRYLFDFFIIALGDWVLRTGCAQNKAWQDAGLTPMRLSVNFSARQFQQPTFISDVAQILNDTNLDPRWLELELTESSIMKDPEEAIEKLHELKLMGIKVAIDDFGTGYSSLNYLKRFPIDTLKIDKSFVSDVCKDPHDTAIVRAIIDLGHALDVTVIAEGVETKEQLQYLSALECDVVQGFLFSKALSVKAFEELLVEQRRVETLV